MEGGKGTDAVDYPVEDLVLPRSRRNVVILLKPTVILLSSSLSLVLGLRISIYLGACIRRSLLLVPCPIASIPPSVSLSQSHHLATHHFPTHRFSSFKLEIVSFTHFLHPRLHVLGQTVALLPPPSLTMILLRDAHTPAGVSCP